MNLYFDTSALIKLIVQEDGSELAAELWASENRVATGILAYPEGRAALASARRGGRLTAAGFGRALSELEAIWREMLIVGVDPVLAGHAGDLADEHGLRGYDAVHLAGALALGEGTTMVSWDAELGSAALDEGCAIAPA